MKKPKPRIRKGAFGLYWCVLGDISGTGATPGRAYWDYERNRFLSAGRHMAGVPW